MSIHLMCLSSGGGLPVFQRHKGDGDNLPYSTIGSLNGTHMFAKSHNIELLHTSTEDHNVVWKEFHDSVVVICVSSGSTVASINKLLVSVFDAMVLVVGIDEIKTMKNIERLKRDLRPCYPIIDRLLDSLDYGDASVNSSDIVMLSESILCHENHLLQIVLDSYAECVDSLFACLLIRGKIAVATENWWTLHPNERKLLAILGSMEHDSTAKESHVFLPYKSPNVAFRLVSCTLIPDVVVCCLCGPTPVLEEIEQTACQCFKNTMETLRSAEDIHPRNFPHTIQLDPEILGILLINTALGKYMLSRNPHQASSNKRNSGGPRLDTLRTFYYQAVSTFLIPVEDSEGNLSDTHGSSETYWCSEYHKCHAAKIGDNIICVLYTSSVPTHTMRLITQKTLKFFTTDKQICW